MTTENIEGVETLTAEQVAALVKERDEAKRLADEYKSGRDNVVAELIDLRKKKETAVQNAVADDADEVTKKVHEALAKRDNERVEEIRKAAFDKFISEHTEFSKENDVAGLKLAALENKLARFNLSGITSEDGFRSVYEDAVRLVRKGSGEGTQTEAPYASSPSGTGATVPAPGSTFTEAERALYTKIGWDVKKYAEMKAKRPEYINQLLNS